MQTVCYFMIVPSELPRTVEVHLHVSTQHDTETYLFYNLALLSSFRISEFDAPIRIFVLRSTSIYCLHLSRVLQAYQSPSLFQGVFVNPQINCLKIQGVTQIPTGYLYPLVERYINSVWVNLPKKDETAMRTQLILFEQNTRYGVACLHSQTSGANKLRSQLQKPKGPQSMDHGFSTCTSYMVE